MVTGIPMRDKPLTSRSSEGFHPEALMIHYLGMTGLWAWHGLNFFEFLGTTRSNLVVEGIHSAHDLLTCHEIKGGFASVPEIQL